MSAKKRYDKLRRNMELQIYLIAQEELNEKIELLEQNQVNQLIRMWESKYNCEDPISILTQTDVEDSIDLIDRTLKLKGGESGVL